MEFSNIKLEINEKKYALITICREEVCNALDEDTSAEIQEALNIISKNKYLRAVVITGYGKKYFSAGADLDKMERKTSLDILESGLQELCIRLQKFKLPIIALVNGYALGGGMEICLSCDFCIASSNAKFGLPELGIGVVPSAGGTERLVNLIGVAKTREIILLGRRLKANEAEELGIINKVVEQDDLFLEAEKMIDILVNKSPMAEYLAKLSINLAVSSGNQSSKFYEKMCQALLAGHVDRKEGIQAFKEKRKPKYDEFL